MNTYLLGAGILALLLGLVGWLWLRRDARKPAPGAGVGARPPAAPARAPRAAADPAAAAALQAPPPAPGAGASIAAQRQAATEALRQARQRKAEEASRLERQRLADAELQAAAPPPRQPLPPAPPPLRRADLPPAPPRPAAPPLAAPPLAVHGPAAEPQPDPPVRPPDAAVPRSAAQPAAPATVLLADDSKVVRVKTGRLLEKQGWRVLLAEDGLAALQLLASESADLLITDVEMPGLDGFELTRRVRAQLRSRRMPVIMITSSDDKHRDEARAAGVDLLLGKPYAEEALLAQVQLLLGASAGLALH